MPEVVICAVARTPVGRYRGSLADRSAVELGIHVVKGLLARAEIDPASVQHLKLTFFYVPHSLQLDPC